MFCPNCGKEIKDFDNFCRYCGIDLRCETSVVKDVVHQEPVHVEEKQKDYEEELVLYDVPKHRMALVVPVFLTLLFFFYFWNIFLNTHSFFSWIVVIAILVMIIYPIARYKSDRFIITTKFAHIKIGVLNPMEIDIPLEKLDMIEVSQTSLGRMLGYGMAAFTSNSERYDYGYIQAPEELQYIIDDPARFAQEILEEATV